jgi:hypothetical protein
MLEKMFIKMWLYFMLCKNSWCNGENFAPQYIGERFKFFLWQLIVIYFDLG